MKGRNVDTVFFKGGWGGPWTKWNVELGGRGGRGGGGAGRSGGKSE